MIVGEEDVATALGYLGEDPHPIAVARKRLTDAENESDRVWATLYRESNGGSVKDREAWADAHDKYKEARTRVSEAAHEFERERARVKSAEMLIEVWRSENANARAAERVR